jgi:hypothetical protein
LTSAIPEDVHRFIVDHIDSVEQLETLLLCHESPTRTWTPESVARALYSNPDSVARRLAGLLADNLLTLTAPPSTYQYLGVKPEVHATVLRLAEAYRERRVAVITVIATKPLQKVRAFSDAFRLRKKDKG